MYTLENSLCAASAVYGIIAQLHMPFTTRDRVRVLRHLERTLREFDSCGTISLHSNRVKLLRRRSRTFGILLVGVGLYNVLSLGIDAAFNEGKYFHVTFISSLITYWMVSGAFLIFLYVYIYNSVLSMGISSLKEDLGLSIADFRNPTRKRIWLKIGHFSRLYQRLGKFIVTSIDFLSVPLTFIIMNMIVELIVQFSMLCQLLLREDVDVEDVKLVVMRNTMGFMLSSGLISVVIYIETMVQLVSPESRYL